MIILKTIVIASAILSVGFSATQCNSDQFEQFSCRDIKCTNTVEGGFTGQLLTKPRNSVIIVGYNKDNFLVKNKEKLSIIPKNNIKTKGFSNENYFKFEVNIHKKSFEICETNIESSEKNVDQINTNSAGTLIKTNDEISTSVLENSDIKSLNENNVTDSNEDFDVSIAVESEEDEENLNTSFVEEPLTTDSNKAENLIYESLSENKNKILNSEPIKSVNSDLSKEISENNSPKPTSAQKLENYSTAECSLDSCVKDTYATKKELVENTETSSNNISTVDTESSYQQKNDHLQLKQFPTVEKTEDPLKASDQNKNLKNAIVENSQNNDNDMEEFNLNSSNAQQLPSYEKTEILKEPVNKEESVNYNTVNLEDNNNNMEELNISGYHQQKNDNLSVSLKLPIEEKTGVPLKESSNNILSMSFNATSFQDNYNEMAKLNETKQKNSSSDPLQNIIVEVSSEDNNDNAQLPSSEKVKLPINNEIDVVNDNTLSNNSVEDNSQEYNNLSTVDEMSDITNDNSEIKSSLHVPKVHKETESQNTQDQNLLSIESTTSNNITVSSNLTHLATSQKLINATDIVSSTNYQKNLSSEVDVIKAVNQKSLDECSSENGCSHSTDNTPKYTYESIDNEYKPENKVRHQSNAHKVMEPNNEKSKEFEPRSIVASFGHPDTCTGVNCLKTKKNVEKMKSPQFLNPIPKQVDPHATSQIINADFGKEKKNVINTISDQSDGELSLLDHFLNWLSSPTLNSIDILNNILSNLYPNQSIENQNIIGHSKHINHSELYFIVMALVTLSFSLIYYKYQKGTYENHLLTLLGAKEQSLLIIEKELSLLKEQSYGNTKSTIEKNSEFVNLNELLSKSEDIISSQALRIEKLEQEVEELTESGMEMHTLLSSALESNTKSAEKLSLLKVKLVDSENLVAALTQKNFDKTTELGGKNDVIKSLQSTVDELTNKNIILVEDNTKISSKLEQTITKNMLKESNQLGEINKLQYELDKQTNALVNAKNEVLAVKDSLQEVLSQNFKSTDTKKFLSSVKLSAELKSTKQICEGYKQKLDESLKLNQQYLDHIDVLKSDLANLEDMCSKLKEKEEESVNKLLILTKFFKEQEKEYLKQINEKALLCDTKEGESGDLSERVKSLNEEITNYKSEIQSLKKEITDQESSFKIQISAADKKASDYWISFRQAERKLKEMEIETAQLRNKLTMVDKKLENGTKSIDSSKDFEDELSDIPLPIVSPDFTLLDFEPPPPIFSPSLQHASVDQRLPPLGALGQAPSPPAPLSRRHNRSLSPGSSPPTTQRSSVFRPLPQRYNFMNRQNSLGHSVESLDK